MIPASRILPWGLRELTYVVRLEARSQDVSAEASGP